MEQLLLHKGLPKTEELTEVIVPFEDVIKLVMLNSKQVR